MGVRVTCDGCLRDGQEVRLTEVGRVQPVLYCPDCLAAWQALEAEEDRVRQDLIERFEVWRREALRQVRGVSLQALPDE